MVGHVRIIDMSSRALLLVGLAVVSSACGRSIVDEDLDSADSGGAGVGGTAGSTNTGGSAGVGGSTGVGGSANSTCASPDAPWQFFPLPTQQMSFVPHRKLWGRATDDVWMIGDAELEHYHFDGSSWTASVGPGLEGFYPAAITGSGANEMYVANTEGLVFRCSGSTCEPVSPSGNAWIVDLWSPAPGHLIAANALGEMRFWNGEAWATYNVNPPNSFGGASFSGVHGNGAGVFAVATDPSYAAWHFDSSAADDGAFLPTPIATVGVAGLNDAWALGPESAVAVGDAAASPPVLVLLTPNTATVIPIVLPAPFDFVLAPRAVWASSDDDVYAVVQSSDGQGFDDSLVVHWSGSEWTIIDALRLEMQDYAQNIDIWGFDARHVFIASTAGVWRCSL